MKHNRIRPSEVEVNASYSNVHRLRASGLEHIIEDVIGSLPQEEFRPIVLPRGLIEDLGADTAFTPSYEIGDEITVIFPVNMMPLLPAGTSRVQSGIVERRAYEPNGCMMYIVNPCTPAGFTHRWQERWVIASKKQALQATAA